MRSEKAAMTLNVFFFFSGFVRGLKHADHLEIEIQQRVLRHEIKIQ